MSLVEDSARSPSPDDGPAGDVPAGLPAVKPDISGRVLLVLLATYIFNLVDRQVVGILAVPIKTDLGLSDTQLGLMGGIAFALFYTILGVPIAWLADRKSRVTIIAVSLAIWSLFTAVCGVAQSFTQLFLARMGVGVGEAGGTAPAHSLISDYFPPEKRARALAIFSLGGPLGAAIGIFFGGWIASNVNWRYAFIILGIAGLALVPIVKLAIPEPRRGGLDRGIGAESLKAQPFLVTTARLASTPSFWLLAFGAAAAAIPSYGLLFWIPSFLQRSHGLDLIQVSMFQGSILLVGGVFGTWAGGWLADKAGMSRPGSYALIPAIAFLFAGPAYAFAVMSQGVGQAWGFFLVAQGLGLMFLGPIFAAIQQIVPPAMRASASAGFLFINNIFGIGFGTYILGFMSDYMAEAYGTEALRNSILYILGFYAVGFLFLMAAAMRLKKDIYRPAQASAA